MSDLAAPGQPSSSPAHRRHRSILLRCLGHGLRSLCLLGAAVTLAGIAVCYSPSLAGTLTAALSRRLTAAPLATYARMEQAAKAGNHADAIREARQFLASLPQPHPADAFGEKYRQALCTLMDSAEAAGDATTRLQAGELALAFDPNDSLLLFNHGRTLADAGRRDEAVQLFEAAFRIRPTAPQILHALEAQLAGAPAERLAALRERHLEALALCMTFPAWMSGNLVATDGTQTKALDLHLSVTGETILVSPLGFRPNSVYMVLPRMPELEVRITVARLVPAAGEAAILQPLTGGNLLPTPDGFWRITPPDGAGFDDPSVISFALPGGLPANSRLEVRVECRPSPAVAATMRTFGTWRHPGVRTVTTD